MKTSYLGSVRFFKNLILLAVIVAIAIPSVLAVHFRRQLSSTQQTLDAQTAAAAAAEAALSESQPPLADSNAAAERADLPSYSSLYPDFYAPKSLTANQSENKTAFLTFDDGPSDRTGEILDVLAQKDVKATFFVIGKDDETSRQLMRDIVDGGHTLGMHSYSHEYAVIYNSVESYLADLYDLFCLIQDATGTTPTLFRMPGGSINGYDYGIYQQILAEMLRRGFVPCDWNISSEDATGSSVTAKKITSTVLSASQNDNRAFILMHDAPGKYATVDALPDMIDGLRAQGYTLLPLSASVKTVLFNYSE